MGRERQLESIPYSDWVNSWIKRIGETISWVYAFLIAIIIMQVVLRKGFSSGLIVLEELQWYLYAIGVMFGVSYSQALDSHVRVDLFYDRYPPKVRHIIEILGLIFFVFPMLWVIFYHSLGFVYESYRTMESSVAPAGLPYRFLIKSVIPASFLMLALACSSRLFRECYLLINGGQSNGN